MSKQPRIADVAAALAVGVLGSVSLPIALAAQIVPAGSEFQVNSYTVASQAHVGVGMRPDGGFIVAWASGHDGHSTGIFAQRYASTGQTSGSEFQVNTYTKADQSWPVAAAGGGGSFVVVWQSFSFFQGIKGQDGDGFGVFGQRYESTGQALGTEFQVNSSTLGFQQSPTVAALADGGFVVAWETFEDQDGNNYGVVAQRFDSTGQAAGTEFQVNSYTLGAQSRPSLAGNVDGSFIVAWTSNLDVFARRFDGTAQALGTDFQVNAHPIAAQPPGPVGTWGIRPKIAPGVDGSFVVAWHSFERDGDGYGVLGRRFNSAGQALGAEFQTNTYTIGDQFLPAVAAGPDASFVLAWISKEQDGSNYGVIAQHYDSAGQATGTEFQVNTHTTSDQLPLPVQFPPSAAGTDDKVVVVWTSVFQDGDLLGIAGQRFVPVASPTQTPTATPCPAVPAVTCLTSARAQLQLKLGPTDAEDRLTWKFTGGPLLTLADFGDPTTSATYVLCIYDNSLLAAHFEIAPSSTLWSATSSKGYKLRDMGGTNDGVVNMKLLGGAAGRSRLQLKGKGTNLPMPTPVTGASFFSGEVGVTAQLREANGDCYTTTFTSADTKRNDSTHYRATR